MLQAPIHFHPTLSLKACPLREPRTSLQLEVQLVHNSTRQGQIENLVHRVTQLGLQHEIVDSAYANSVALCRYSPNSLVIVDSSVPDVQAGVLVGNAIASGQSLLMLHEGDMARASSLGGVNNVRMCHLSELAERLADLARIRGSNVLQVTASGIFGAIDEQDPVAIVCAEIPEELRPPYAVPSHSNYLRYATFADIDALIQLMVWFAASKHRTVSSYTSRTIPENALASHLMIVGGPQWNSLARSVYDQINLPIAHNDGDPGNSDTLFDRSTGEVWAPELRENGEIDSDVGFLAQTPSPFYQGRIIILFGGVLTHGVEASVKLCTAEHVWAHNHRVIESLTVHANDGFCLVFRCRVLSNTNVAPDLMTAGTVLAAYSRRQGQFSRVNIV